MDPLENPDNPEDLFNVIGADDGKGVLKIVFNSSTTKLDKGKNKVMNSKCSIILAAVSHVKESYHNMGILFKLTNLNDVPFKLSQDLKLTSIVIGITCHSSKYPCPYGECYKDEYGLWIKGRDQTIENLTENQKKWCTKSRIKSGNRKTLKDFKNCEFIPLLTSEKQTPIIYTIPPPPLHILLLGPILG